LIAEEQIVAAGEVLADAFVNDPLCVYTQPHRDARMSQFTWLFTQLVRAAAAQGSVYTNTQLGRPAGVAVWLPPQGGGPAAEVAVWSEMDQMEQCFGTEAYRRFTYLRRGGPCLSAGGKRRLLCVVVHCWCA